MAISPGGAAGLSEVASATSLTTAYTVTAGSNLLVVAVGGDFTTIDTGGGHDDITGITYNGVALTLAGKLISNPTNSPRYLYVYFLFNPPTGVSQNVIVSCTNAHFLSAAAADYKGVAVVTTPDNVATNVDTTATLTSLTSSITPVAAGCWAIMATTGYANGAAPTAGTGATFRAVDDVIVSPTNNCGLFDTNGAITAGVPKSMTFNEAVANGIGAILVTFAPLAGIPKKRKKLKPTQRKTLKPRRRRIAAYIGGNANLFLNPPKQAWNWNKQAPPLSLALGTVSKSWVWVKNAPPFSLQLGAPSKAWAWAKNAPTFSLALGAISKSWSWAKNAPPLRLSLGVVSKSGVWAKNAPTFSLALGAVSKSWVWAKNAMIIGGNTLLSPPSHVWNWAKNASQFGLSLGTVSKSWAWTKNAATMNLALGTVSKSWVWAKNAVPLGQVLGTVSKSWVWAKNAPVLVFNAGLLLTSKPWQWVHRAAVLNIKSVTAAYNIMRGVVRGVVRPIVTWVR